MKPILSTRWLMYYRELGTTTKDGWLYAWRFMKDHCQNSIVYKHSIVVYEP